MNIERLEHMIVILNKINSANFNLGNWGKINPEKNLSIKAQQECGTVCCAIGWALMSPKFQKEGLKTSKYFSFFVGQNAIAPVFGKDSHGYQYEGWDAVSMFFKIKRKTASFLFDEASYLSGADTTPAQVIERIKVVLEKGEIF